MKKREFAELFMVKANLRSKEEAKRQVELFIETMKEALTQDDVLIFRGLGTFERRKLREKREETLEQGEAIKITPKKYIKFKVGKDLEDRINKPAKRGRKAAQ